MDNVIVRFAPSPTGLFHVGSARTALFNWMWAKAKNGKFLLRIEDTDTERSTKESLANILEGLNTLGLDYDGEVYYASEHRTEQIDAAKALVAHNLAYYCTCTHEDTLARGTERGYDGYCRDKANTAGLIRFKNDAGEVTFTDAISGLNVREGQENGDFALLKANEDPLFIFQNVYDDANMGVTWVIRGADHLNNNARYILVWEALVAAGVFAKPLPFFAHLPLIMGPSGKKLSKRKDKVDLDLFINEEGILPSAFLTYISSLGWGAPAGHDRDSVTDLVQFFDVHDVVSNNSIMDPMKLRAINADQLRDLAEKDPVEFNRQLNANLGKTWDLIALDLIEAVSTRIATFKDAEALLVPLFEDVEIEAKLKDKWFSDNYVELLKEYATAYETLPWEKEILEAHARDTAAKHSLGMMKATMSVRVAALRSDKGLPLFEALGVLGREEVLKRLTSHIGL